MSNKTLIQNMAQQELQMLENENVSDTNSEKQTEESPQSPHDISKNIKTAKNDFDDLDLGLEDIDFLKDIASTKTSAPSINLAENFVSPISIIGIDFELDEECESKIEGYYGRRNSRKTYLRKYAANVLYNSENSSLVKNSELEIFCRNTYGLTLDEYTSETFDKKYKDLYQRAGIGLGAVKTTVSADGKVSIQKAKTFLELVDEYETTTVDMHTLAAKAAVEPFRSKTCLDLMFSIDGGILKGTVNIATGAPGTGKTSGLMQLAQKVKRNHPEAVVKYFSNEMRPLDWDFECKYNPSFRDIPVVFASSLKDLSGEKLMAAIYKVILECDFIIIDSIKTFTSLLKSKCGMTTEKATDWLIGICNEISENRLTTIFCIQQMTKGKTFAGSNSIEHDTTSMMYFMRDKKTGDRYLFFTKNRRNGTIVGLQVLYRKDRVTGEIIFDQSTLFMENPELADKYNTMLEEAKLKVATGLISQQEFEDFDNSFTNAAKKQNIEKMYFDKMRDAESRFKSGAINQEQFDIEIDNINEDYYVMTDNAALPLEETSADKIFTSMEDAMNSMFKK
jgi:KaiC/GvpD/RAD55 family RecA-like ATPase